MAWRVTADGAMLEVLLGTTPDGQEKTRTAIFREGAIIKEDLSKSQVERYDGNDETIRAQVERVELSTDDDGNEVATPVGAPTSSESSTPATDKKAVQRAESAEKEAAELRSETSRLSTEQEQLQARISELEGQLSSTQSELESAQKAVNKAEDSASNALSYSDLSVEALRAEAEKKELAVARADGKEGDPLKSDLVNALEEDRTSS